MLLAICDDDLLQVEVLKNYIDEMELVHNYEVFQSFEQLMFAIDNGKRYDVLLMDIEWNQERNGIDYAVQVNEKRPECQIIFFSNYTKYSQDIFREQLNLCGFLIKPVDREHFQDMLERAKKRLMEAKKNQLIIRNRNAYVFFTYQLLYIESSAHQVIIHADREDIECYEKLSNLESRLDNNFAKCHKSFLVNMDRIRRITGSTIIFDNDVQINMSRQKAEEFKRTYFDYIQKEA